MLENADLSSLFQTGCPSCRELRQAPVHLRDVTSDLQTNSGLAAYVTIDRATAARFGITPATVDNALYDAFGQRIVSTIFTQSNQYRDHPGSQSRLAAFLASLNALYLPSSTAGPAARCR